MACSVSTRRQKIIEEILFMSVLSPSASGPKRNIEDEDDPSAKRAPPQRELTVDEEFVTEAESRVGDVVRRITSTTALIEDMLNKGAQRSKVEEILDSLFTMKLLKDATSEDDLLFRMVNGCNNELNKRANNINQVYTQIRNIEHRFTRALFSDDRAAHYAANKAKTTFDINDHSYEVDKGFAIAFVDRNIEQYMREYDEKQATLRPMVTDYNNLHSFQSRLDAAYENMLGKWRALIVAVNRAVNELPTTDRAQMNLIPIVDELPNADLTPVELTAITGKTSKIKVTKKAPKGHGNLLFPPTT
jgi:hypothetical protein